MTASDRELHFSALKLTTAYFMAFCLGALFAVLAQAVLS